MIAGLSITRGSAFGIADYVREFNSNATLTAGDLVNVESGKLELVSTSDLIAGVVMESATNASTGVQVNVTPALQVVMDSDGSGVLATQIGARFMVTGATGAQIIDISSVDTSATAPSGQLVLLQNNPQGIAASLDSDTSVGLFMIAKHQFAGTR